VLQPFSRYSGIDSFTQSLTYRQTDRQTDRLVEKIQSNAIADDNKNKWLVSLVQNVSASEDVSTESCAGKPLTSSTSSSNSCFRGLPFGFVGGSRPPACNTYNNHAILIFYVNAPLFLNTCKCDSCNRTRNTAIANRSRVSCTRNRPTSTASP